MFLRLAFRRHGLARVHHDAGANGLSFDEIEEAGQKILDDGLAIAADIARQHGGSLRLEQSKALGGLKADLILAR